MSCARIGKRECAGTESSERVSGISWYVPVNRRGGATGFGDELTVTVAATGVEEEEAPTEEEGSAGSDTTGESEERTGGLKSDEDASDGKILAEETGNFAAVTRGGGVDDNRTGGSTSIVADETDVDDGGAPLAEDGRGMVVMSFSPSTTVMMSAGGEGKSGRRLLAA